MNGQEYDLDALGALGAVDGARDTLEWDGRRWTLTRRTWAHAFDGTEGEWQKSSSYAGSYYRNWTKFASQTGGKPGAPFLCSHAAPARSRAQYAIGTCYSDGSCCLWFHDGASMPALSDWRAYLAAQHAAGTPVTVRYQLAAPIVAHPDLPAPVFAQGENRAWAEGSGVAAEIAAKYLTHR